MLRDDAIYNSSFRLRDISLSNVNDINLAINIVVIATTLFKTLITITLILKLVIIIVFNVDDIVTTTIVAFKKPVFKLIAFDFDIKRRFAMSASLDKP